MTLIFSLAALRGGRRGVPPRARAARRGRRRPVERALGRELLRLARRHRGRQAARRDRRPGARAAGASSRSRTRSSRTSTGCEAFSRPALGVPRRQGRDEAALPLGVDVDEEPGVPRRDVRRGADRARDGQHDAGETIVRVPGSRRGRGDTVTRGRRGGAHADRASCAEVGVDYDDVVETLEAEGVQKFADSFDGAARRDPREAGRARRGVTRSSADELVGRIWARDPSVWTGGGRGAVARLARRRRAHARARRRARARSPTRSPTSVRRRRPARHGRLEPRAGGAAADVRRRERSTCSTRRTRRRSARLERDDRPRADALPRGVEVRLDARDALAPRVLLGATVRKRRAVRRDHRSRARRSSGSQRERGFRAVFPGEPTIGGRYSALSPFGMVPAALMGVDLARFLDERRPDARRLPGATTATPASSSASQLGAGWQEGRDKVCIDPNRRRLRPLGRAADRGVDRQAGQGPRAGAGRVARRARTGRRPRSSSPTRTTSAASSSAGSSRPPSPARSSAINPFDQPDVQAAKDKTNEVLAVGRGAGRSSREGVARRAARAGAAPPRLRLRSRRSSTRPTEDELDAARSRRRARAPAASSRTGSARATSTRPGSCTRAARTPGSSSRSSTTPATSCRSRASRSASAG